MSSPQAMHAAVLAGFPPDQQSNSGTRVLWRLDRGARHELSLYVSSPTPPELKHLVESAGWETAPETWQSADCRPFLSRLAVGQHWGFRLTANPTRSVKVAGSTRGKRYAHVTASQQSDWLVARSSRLGFDLPKASPEAEESFAVVERRTLQFQRRSDGQPRSVVIGAATFEGTLQVSDPDALRSALVDGVGSAKAYGCGLLTLAPSRS